MMPEIGNGLLCLALGIALLLSVYPLWGVARGDARMMASSRLFAWLLFMSVAGAFLVLVNAFVVNDFTVTYVASNSNTQLPVWYRVAATWGAHEGSLLLWVLLMSGWTFAVAIFSQRIPLDIVARVLAIMGMVSVGFLLFILFTSNLVRWGRDRPRKIRNLLIIAFISTLVLSLLLPWLFESKVVAMTVLGLAMACWIAVLAIAEAALRISRGTKTTFSYWGMVAAHLGLAVTIVGIAFSQNYSVERDVRMKSGDSVDIHEYRFTFRDVKEVTGPNWRGGVATIGVTRDGKPETVLYAEKRYYNTAGSMMTEAAIDGGITRDLYAALGEELENGAWAVRLYYKPFVRWIWAGGLMMALGGLLCLFDPRYRKRVSPQKTAPEAV
ncbi:hypothetical protein E3C66_06305 [Escherichia coli]|nr:hypothetical protein [Escherichia coli]